MEGTKIWVQLKDIQSIFFCEQQVKSIAGGLPSEVIETTNIKNAIFGGILKKLSKEEAKQQIKKYAPKDSKVVEPIVTKTKKEAEAEVKVEEKKKEEVKDVQKPYGNGK